MVDSTRWRRCCVAVYDSSADQRAHEHTDPVGEKGHQTLRSGAQGGGGFLVDVDLAHDEEEVVADAVEDDSDIEHPGERSGIAVAEHDVANHPSQHAEH